MRDLRASVEPSCFCRGRCLMRCEVILTSVKCEAIRCAFAGWAAPSIPSEPCHMKLQPYIIGCRWMSMVSSPWPLQKFAASCERKRHTDMSNLLSSSQKTWLCKTSVQFMIFQSPRLVAACSRRTCLGPNMPRRSLCHWCRVQELRGLAMCSSSSRLRWRGGAFSLYHFTKSTQFQGTRFQEAERQGRGPRPLKQT